MIQQLREPTKPVEPAELLARIIFQTQYQQ